MKARKIKDGIFWMGSIDWDARLFDSLIPLPALRPKVKFVSIIGSYGWGGKTVEILAGMISNLKVEIIEPQLIKGTPSGSDFKALDNLAETIALKHGENGFI